MAIDKACPVLLRNRETLEVLAFQHPLAGLQLVKGSVEPGESSGSAAVRELVEEAGVRSQVLRDLGIWRSPTTQQVWAFHECRALQDLPDTWVHYTEDDGGHDFRFFWQTLASEPSEEWHQVYKEALGFLRVGLGSSSTR